MVRDYAAARAYEQWLESYVQSTLKLIPEKDLPGIQLTSFLPKFKSRLLRASNYWSANVLESVAAIEAADAQNPTVQPELQRPPASTEHPVRVWRNRDLSATRVRNSTERRNPLN